jgi:phosphoribosylformylglycinamidine (FGAM) synthase-like amidotransferase family enzyme
MSDQQGRILNVEEQIYSQLVKGFSGLATEATLDLVLATLQSIQTNLINVTETVWTDDTGVFFLRILKYNESTQTITYSYTLFDGTSYTPLAANHPRPADRASNINNIQYKYKATVAGTGFSIGDVLSETQFYDATNSNSPVLKATLWFNETTQIIVSPAPNPSSLSPETFNVFDPTVNTSINAAKTDGLFLYYDSVNNKPFLRTYVYNIDGTVNTKRDTLFDGSTSYTISAEANVIPFDQTIVNQLKTQVVKIWDGVNTAVINVDGSVNTKVNNFPANQTVTVSNTDYAKDATITSLGASLIAQMQAFTNKSQINDPSTGKAANVNSSGQLQVVDNSTDLSGTLDLYSYKATASGLGFSTGDELRLTKTIVVTNGISVPADTWYNVTQGTSMATPPNASSYTSFPNTAVTITGIPHVIVDNFSAVQNVNVVQSIAQKIVDAAGTNTLKVNADGSINSSINNFPANQTVTVNGVPHIIIDNASVPVTFTSPQPVNATITNSNVPTNNGATTTRTVKAIVNGTGFSTGDELVITTYYTFVNGTYSVQSVNYFNNTTGLALGTAPLTTSYTAFPVTSSATGLALDTSVQAINAKLPASLGPQTNANSLSVTLPTGYQLPVIEGLLPIGAKAFNASNPDAANNYQTYSYYSDTVGGTLIGTLSLTYDSSGSVISGRVS